MNEIKIKEELQPVAVEAMELKIKSHGDLLVGTDLLSKLNIFNDKIQEEKEKVTKPLNEALKAERARWRPMERFYEEAIDHVRSEMTAYQTLITNEQKEKEKALADKLEKGELTIEETITAISSVETPAKNIATMSGDVRFRETKILKIWDHTMIPREYLLPDEKAILTALKEGKKVEGCELEIIQTPVNYR
jgi:hypothetical protein